LSKILELIGLALIGGTVYSIILYVYWRHNRNYCL